MTTRVEDLSPEAVVDVDHLSTEFKINEIEAWSAVRSRCPVAFNPRYGGFWMATGYAAVADASRDDATFAHRYDPSAQDGIHYVGTIGIPRPDGYPGLGVNEAEGPLHQLLRRTINPYLAPRQVEKMRPFVEQTAAWFLDQRIGEGAMDLVLDFASPIPAVLTLALMGMPTDGWKHYSDLMHAAVAYPADSEEFRVAMSAMPGMITDITDLVRTRRADPKEDLTSALAALEFEGQPLGDQQIVNVMWNVIAGGLDTSTSTTGWSLHFLALHPEVRAQLVTRPDMVPSAVEEFLRHFAVSRTLARTVTRDVVLDGHQLRRGDHLLVSYVGANHDDAEFNAPHVIDIERTPNRHFAFGSGPHRCLGSHLARVLIQSMLTEVLTRVPDYTLVDERPDQYIAPLGVSGLKKLPVTFCPGPIVGVDTPFRATETTEVGDVGR
ncbi:cytochrome P450 [Mycobacterium paraintracellulare]|uniref:cytochrome P450 n=1 Tax=Mycobacterium paraintracellulare TaxID=1138383 RepID=UPI001928395D|nr:cytochrome P450 [Mycobacterium paraintracellulare]BCP05403.1 cytochrome P450 [Mycobacterium paraintracellulare]